MAVFYTCSTRKVVKMRQDTQGFTLLELLIVCLLISISLAVTVPSLRLSILADELGRDARRIISLLGEVRSRAMGEQQAYLVHLDSVEKKIWYETENQDQPEEQDERLVKKQRDELVYLSENVQLEGVLVRPANTSDRSTQTLWINRQGYTKQTVIQLSNDAGEYLSIELRPFINDIKVYDTLQTLD